MSTPSTPPATTSVTTPITVPTDTPSATPPAASPTTYDKMFKDVDTNGKYMLIVLAFSELLLFGMLIYILINMNQQST